MWSLHTTIEDFAADGYTHIECHCPRCRAIRLRAALLIQCVHVSIPSSRGKRQSLYAWSEYVPETLQPRQHPMVQFGILLWVCRIDPIFKHGDPRGLFSRKLHPLKRFAKFLFDGVLLDKQPAERCLI